MFETAEVGHKVSKQDFSTQEPELHTRLLHAQRALAGSDTPVIVIVAGVEGAGKGAVVRRLNAWLDARGVTTAAFWDESDEERERPRYWRFWRALPARGSIGIMFGSWYTRPIIDRVFKRIDDVRFGQELDRIASFERALCEDGAILVKLWFHLSRDTQRERLMDDARDRTRRTRVSPLTRKFSKSYQKFRRTSERAIRETDTGFSPWHVIEATNARYRDLAAGRILLEALERRAGPEAAAAGEPSQAADEARRPAEERLDARTVLDAVPLDRTVSRETYRRQLAKRQNRLYDLAWKARGARRHVVVLFEGWDAAGKGGAIRRITGAMDPRLYRVISVAAPTDEERAHHYLWRFWRHVPRAGYVTIYDRSWYGRVLVERVEGFARPHEWQRAYQEINQFEEQLAEHGVIIVKFWIHIDADEQLRRFKEREETPWKMHKITEEDWRNRERWSAYQEAVNEMVARCSTAHAPWTLVSGNDKLVARLEVLKTMTTRLEAALG